MADPNPLDKLPARAKARLRKIAQPAWVSPMLATLTDKRFSREGWLFEPKWDGERCLAFRNGEHLQLFSRNQKRLNEKYPEITAAFHRQDTDSFIADGEIVAFKNGVTSFAKLQQRMQVEHPPANLLRVVPVWLYLFDLLYLDDYDTPGPYSKQILRAHPISSHTEPTYQQAPRGIIQNRTVSPKDPDWLKFKCTREQEFVIGGYTIRRGSGPFPFSTLQRLARQLAKLETAICPFVGDGLPRRGVHWVKPKLVAQIGFTEWTPAEKLRHPRFLGLRQDKKPEEVVREG